MLNIFNVTLGILYLAKAKRVPINGMIVCWYDSKMRKRGKNNDYFFFNYPDPAITFIRQSLSMRVINRLYGRHGIRYGRKSRRRCHHHRVQ